MTIRSGDRFRDEDTTMDVYGFKIDADAPDGRRILVVTDAGEKSEVDPWDLMSDCALEPTKDKDALVVFDSEIHGKPILN